MADNTVTNPPDSYTVSKQTAERGLFLAIIMAVIGYFNLGITVTDNNKTYPPVLIDDKDFVKSAAEAINNAHAEIAALKVRTATIEKRLSIVNPVSPGSSGSVSTPAPIGSNGPKDKDK